MDYVKISDIVHFCCGKTGIRTLEPRKRLTVFETAPFGHSGIFPIMAHFVLQTSLCFKISNAKVTIYFEIFNLLPLFLFFNFENLP